MMPQREGSSLGLEEGADDPLPPGVELEAGLVEINPVGRGPQGSAQREGHEAALGATGRQGTGSFGRGFPKGVYNHLFVQPARSTEPVNTECWGRGGQGGFLCFIEAKKKYLKNKTTENKNLQGCLNSYELGKRCF